MPRPVAVAITGGIGAGKSAALAAFRAHGAATVSSDEIVHHLLATDLDVRAALVERFGDAILDEDGAPDRGKIAAVVFGDDDGARLPRRRCCTRSSRASTSLWREQLAALDDPPEVCVTEVPLLYESGGETRFDRVVVITAPRQLREQRRQVPLDNRDDRLIDDREKVARADFHYVNTGTLRGSRRVGRRRHDGAGERRIVRRLLIARGGRSQCSARSRWRSLDASAGLRPAHPLPAAVRGDRARACEELRSRPVAARGRHLHGEPVQRHARAPTAGAMGLMQLLPDTARGIAVRTGGDAFVVDDLYSPEINVRYGAWYLRNLLDRYGDERTALAAYHAGPGNVDSWRRQGVGIQFPETRSYVDKVEHVKQVYADAYAKELGLR